MILDASVQIDFNFKLEKVGLIMLMLRPHLLKSVISSETFMLNMKIQFTVLKILKKIMK